MKYLYIRLNGFEIITFKSVTCSIGSDSVRVIFNGTEGCFKTVKTIDEAEEIVSKIMYYIQQDTPKYRILDLS